MTWSLEQMWRDHHDKVSPNPEFRQRWLKVVAAAAAAKLTVDV
jgi:hypothetical protein